MKCGINSVDNLIIGDKLESFSYEIRKCESITDMNGETEKYNPSIIVTFKEQITNGTNRWKRREFVYEIGNWEAKLRMLKTLSRNK